MALTLVDIATGVSGNAGTPTGQATTKVTVPSGVSWEVYDLHIKLTTSAIAGNRYMQVLFKDPTNVVKRITATGNYQASTTPIFDAANQLSTQYALGGTLGTYVTFPFTPITLPAAYTISTYDVAQISPSAETGTATAMSATTMTVAGTPWVVNAFAGYVVTMLGSTGTVASNTNHILTIDAWSPVLSGTADASSTTTMTFNAGTWATNALVGGTVAMGGSTAVITANTGNVLTFAAWVAPGPATGAFTIIGPYSQAGTGDTVELTVFWNAKSPMIA